MKSQYMKLNCMLTQAINHIWLPSKEVKAGPSKDNGVIYDFVIEQ